jgi:hypothetical protein
LPSGFPFTGITEQAGQQSSQYQPSVFVGICNSSGRSPHVSHLACTLREGIQSGEMGISYSPFAGLSFHRAAAAFVDSMSAGTRANQGQWPASPSKVPLG